ncbi:MAG: transposase [Acidobacteriota bacterium]
MGFFSLLHTWGQNLRHPPHLHCIVPAGGISPDQHRWIPLRKNFFLSMRVLPRLFRAVFLAQLDASSTWAGAAKGHDHQPPLAQRQQRSSELPLQTLQFSGRDQQRGFIKGKRWLPLTRWFHRNGNKWQMLNELFRHNRGFLKAYPWKKSLHRLCTCKHEAAERRYLNHWIDQLQ